MAPKVNSIRTVHVWNTFLQNQFMSWKYAITVNVWIYTVFSRLDAMATIFSTPCERTATIREGLVFKSGIYFFTRQQSHWLDNALIHLHARTEVCHQCGGIFLQCGVYFCCFQHLYLYFPLYIAQLFSFFSFFFLQFYNTDIILIETKINNNELNIRKSC